VEEKNKQGVKEQNIVNPFSDCFVNNCKELKECKYFACRSIKGKMKLRKIMIFLFFSLLGLLFLSGCNSNDTNKNSDIFQFKDSFVGDNSAVSNISNQLLGAEHLNGFELKTNDETYGIILNYDWIESEQDFKELVIHNATFLFTLVQNVDWITFNSDSLEYTITKESLQEWYGKELSEVQNEDELTGLIQEHFEDENEVSQFLN